ncbi:MAG: stage 0 sporulation family protein [Coriobacteriia bacterium]|nr:stage 0 sporulation family protein [Coriobacteriia bacterium]
MPTVVGVKLRYAPKQLWFDPAGTTPEEGDSVIVDTERGIEIGLVSAAPHDVEPSQLTAPLKPVMRVAGPEDFSYQEELEGKEREAMPAFRELINSYKLDMKPIDVEYMFGGDKIVFYFVAEERVDFRELVKDLAARFKARIDMRQVGVRDEARMVGGLGHCGEQLCCVRFGGEFQPVSIRMAKEQDLPLNPLKISGLCGRLMCCLRYEFEAYKDFKSRAPKRGAIIETPLGLAKVAELHTPRETIGMKFEDGKRVTVPLAGMTCSKGTGCPCSVSREVLEEAGGTGTALAFAALDREEEAAAAPPKPAPRPRSGGGERKPAQSAERPADKPADAPKGEGRKRRRRGGRGGGEGAAGGAAAPAQPERAKAPQADKPAAAAGEGGAPKASRRRRKRRPGSGGTGGEAPPA